jgi:hypothetical protein
MLTTPRARFTATVGVVVVRVVVVRSGVVRRSAKRRFDPCVDFDALADDPRVDVDALPDDPRVDLDALLMRRDDDSTEAATPDTLASTACNPPCAWTMGAMPGRS